MAIVYALGCALGVGFGDMILHSVAGCGMENLGAVSLERFSWRFEKYFMASNIFAIQGKRACVVNVASSQQIN